MEQNVRKAWKEELLFLLLKIAIWILLLYILLFVLFGIARCENDMMEPAVKVGDVVVYNRLEKKYSPSQLVVMEKDGKEQIRRIVAVAGDQVNITEEGLEINGYLQQERDICKETLPYRDGVSFPLTVEQGHYFVLGDNRSNAEDSRVYGTVSKEELKGSVITLLRHRDF